MKLNFYILSFFAVICTNLFSDVIAIIHQNEGYSHLFRGFDLITTDRGLRIYQDDLIETHIGKVIMKSKNFDIYLGEKSRLSLAYKNDKLHIYLSQGSMTLHNRLLNEDHYQVYTPSSTLYGNAEVSIIEVKNDDLTVITIMRGEAYVDSMDNFQKTSNQRILLKQTQQSRIELTKPPRAPRDINDVEFNHYADLNQLIPTQRKDHISRHSLIPIDSVFRENKLRLENEDLVIQEFKEGNKLTQDIIDKARDDSKDSFREDMREEGTFSFPNPLSAPPPDRRP